MLISLLVSWFNHVDVRLYHINGWCQLMVYNTYVCRYVFFRPPPHERGLDPLSAILEIGCIMLSTHGPHHLCLHACLYRPPPLQKTGVDLRQTLGRPTPVSHLGDWQHHFCCCCQLIVFFPGVCWYNLPALHVTAGHLSDACYFDCLFCGWVFSRHFSIMIVSHAFHPKEQSCIFWVWTLNPNLGLRDLNPGSTLQT